MDCCVYIRFLFFRATRCWFPLNECKRTIHFSGEHFKTTAIHLENRQRMVKTAIVLIWANMVQYNEDKVGVSRTMRRRGLDWTELGHTQIKVVGRALVQELGNCPFLLPTAHSQHNRRPLLQTTRRSGYMNLHSPLYIPIHSHSAVGGGLVSDNIHVRVICKLLSSLIYSWTKHELKYVSDSQITQTAPSS